MGWQRPVTFDGLEPPHPHSRRSDPHSLVGRTTLKLGEAVLLEGHVRQVFESPCPILARLSRQMAVAGAVWRLNPHFCRPCFQMQPSLAVY